MQDHFEITVDNNLVRVYLTGREDMEVAMRLWPQIAETCERLQCFNVLGIAETTQPLETLDAYKHAELFEQLGINHKYRIAWVELNPQAFMATAFAETVLHNRGLPGRLFSSEADARRWLEQS